MNNKHGRHGAQKEDAIVEQIHAFAVMRCKGGWKSLDITLNYPTMEVVDCVATQPDIKAQAIERFKIMAAKNWQNQENGLAQ